MMKKALASVLSVLMVASLAACGGTPSTGDSGSPADEASVSVQAEDGSAPSSEAVTITVWHGMNALEAHFTDLAARYQEESGHTIDVTMVENDTYKEKLKIAMAADETPDIYQHWAGGPMNTYVDAGLALDLTDYMNADNYKSVWMDSAIEMCTYNDKIYATPGSDLMAFPLYYNRELLAEHGYETFPETIAELETMCDTLVADGIIPFALANKNKWPGSVYYMYLVDRYGNGKAFLNAANRVDGGTFEDDAFTKAGEKLQEWVKKGYFPEGMNGLDNSTAQDRQLLYSDMAAMWSYPSTGLGFMKDENPEAYEKMSAAMFPRLEAGGSASVVGSAGQNFFSICPSCPDPDAAWGFLKLFSDSTWIDTLVDNGYCPPTTDAMDRVTDPLRLEALTFLQTADFAQLPWDQYLTPALGELHKNTSQELYGLTKTPAVVNREMEAAAATELGAGQG